ncbi:NGFI-A-binding protein 2 isoform X1 [Apus apus]|uniref:NGFI-A-binding protein 2 isoform X1 n=1 Tax=Apus apus TaxID=8895 RepID=UPI0021F882D9|nr:NGFI-A-binding protein 2 isoform X1 [Apus apus]
MALPRTLGELQLYRVLQRANLLGYYETFIQQGGDDVQQLCEAGEEEFLEIMALVGMATKPLHVRRLQKALREWASNPGLFSQPVSAVPVSSIPLFKLSEAGGRKALSNGHASPGEAAGKGGSSAGTPPACSPTEPGEKLSPSAGPPWPGRSTPESEGGGDEEPGGPPFSPGGSGGEQPVGMEVLEPELVRTVAESVERLLQSCPRGGEAELRALMKLNKKLAKAVGHIFQLEDGDRAKEEEIRRHSAIYGRGEARRREGKQLTLHEVGTTAGSMSKVRGTFKSRGQGGSGGGRGSGSDLGRRLWAPAWRGGSQDQLPPRQHLPAWSRCCLGCGVSWVLLSLLTHHLGLQLIINEAAAQFCLRDNSLLLRRVELFSLSRQVARESTYLSSLKVTRAHPEESGATVAKRLKQEAGEQSRPELLPLPGGPETPGAAFRASLEEDTGSLSGESLDGHLQVAGACPRLTPPPGVAPDVPLGVPPHGLWSRHILQQTLMDEGLRLARLVSHERVGRLSPCLPGKPPGPEFEDGLAERGAPPPPEPPRGTIKVEQETSRQ